MPAKFRKIVKALKHYGVTVESGSKHWQARRGSLMYPLPAHGNGAELSEIYIKGLCRKFDIDLADFKSKI